MKVVSVPLNDIVRLDMDLDVQVARRPAIQAWLAVARGAYAHAVVDTRRNLDLQCLVLADAPDTITRRAGIGDFLAGAMAGGAGLLHAEKALLHANSPRAIASVAGLGRSSGLGA